MPLESLLQLVETLRERISAHRAALSQSEALTRYALIDPLLRELGWETSDPNMVVPEYSSGTGKADYALLSNGRPAMMVEAKKLGTRLRDVAGQGIQYCLIEGTPYFILTDGARWEIYETHRPVPIDEKRVVEFDLMNQSPADACLKVLALWRPSAQSGTVTEGSLPVLTPALEIDSSPTPIPIPVTETTQSATQYDKALHQQGWQRLPDVAWIKGHPKPVAIQFPDNSSKTVSTWKSLMTEAAQWLTDGNFLTSNQCPIQYAQRYLVSTDTIHPTGNKMSAPRSVNSLYVETNYNAPDCVRNTKTIIQHVGLDPTDFKVRFS